MPPPSACTADGVAVFLIYAPDIVGTQRTHLDREAFVTEIRKMVAGCPFCHVLDYGSDPRFPAADSKYVIDGGYGDPNSHLSKAGAEAFSELWVPDVQAILGQAGSNRRPSILQPPSSTR